MWLYILTIVVLMSTTYGTGNVNIASPIEIVARCRVRCLTKFLKGVDSHSNQDACSNNRNCAMCWKSCRLLFESYRVWGSICKKNATICNQGCQTACQFRSKIPKGVPSPVPWHFQEKGYTVIDSSTQNINIIWEPPVSEKEIRPGHLVYILLMSDMNNKNNIWEQLEQTPLTYFYLESSDIPVKPEFWLKAVGENGTIADTKFTSESKLFDTDFVAISENMNSELKDVNSPLNISVKMVNSSGTVNAVINWQHPHVTEAEELGYTVNWFMDDCNMNPHGPYCDLPLQHFASSIYFQKNEQPTYTIRNLLFNTMYTIHIVPDDDEWDNKDMLENEIQTPDCNEVDVTYTICLSSEKTSTEAVLIHWALNVTSLEYNPGDKEVLARITWSAPFNQSLVEYKVTCETIDAQQFHIQEHWTNATWFILELKPHNKYKVNAEALYTTISGARTSFPSMVLEINTSKVELMSLSAQRHTDRPGHNRESRTLNGMIIGVVCVAGIIMLAFIIVIIYKKRRSFRDIIITKTAVAKSNSYKSNVGCKVDYSNQLLMLSDEWELDTKLLIFSSPIGQGAFGKVVTGYYHDMRVAIKLVRDSAPLSYKEDLLAEINLMKRIGSHPNIVSMIGACTIVEPIALVMEFIPLGNLQNFLKKCRQEGDLRKRNGGPSEITYSMMDENGDVDSGVVTPADMLSFARQVAMAMEYLAEKKYVHRDLAARNVLIDFNKVVKVCDFGLSRDIYNENQYQKLTSGKLPLKWMAIESLRDRIFTTCSDVWSFGILLWEIVTMGASPYPNIALADLYYVLSNAYRMEKPSNCSDELYMIMKRTWLFNPHDRPNFTELRLELENLLTRDRNYLELENINVPLSTSESSSIPISDESSPSLLAANALQVNLPPKGEMTVDVNIHERSTERLILRRDQGDSSNLTNL